MNSQFIRFGLVGTAGLVVDLAALYAALWCGAGLYSGRAVSYLAAATATWRMNRHFTFRSSATANPVREWLRFLVVNSLGGAVNWIVYASLVHAFPLVASWPALAVGAGSLSGMMVNFTLSRRLVFNAKAA